MARDSRRQLHVLAAALALGLTAAAPAHAEDRYVAPNGGGGSCTTPASACGSVAAAFRAATPGDVISVAAGSYPEQNVPRVAGRVGPSVEVRPAAGAAVTFGGLNVDGGHVTVRGIRTGNVSIDGGETSPTVIENVVVDGGVGNELWIRNTRNVTIRGGSYGGIENDAPVKIGSAPSSTDLTFDGVDFHDAVATDPTVHMECVWAGDIQRFTVRNSIFRNCAYFGLFITHLFGTEPRDVLIENNVFETTKQPSGEDAPYAMMVAGSLSVMDGFTFRNNTFGSDFALLAPRAANSLVVGNIGPIGACIDGVNYRYNVWTRMRCGPGDSMHRDALRQFVDPVGHDWRLLPGAAAIGAADPANHPETDRFGQPRGSRPDAGAHQFATDASPPASASPPTSASPLLSARLTSRSVCARRRPGCRRTSTTLRVRLSEPARLSIRIERRRGNRIVRSRTVNGRRGTTSVRLRGAGLRRGARHRVGVTVLGAGGERLATKWITLRVR